MSLLSVGPLYATDYFPLSESLSDPLFTPCFLKFHIDPAQDRGLSSFTVLETEQALSM